jgi:hypothetical protein
VELAPQPKWIVENKKTCKIIIIIKLKQYKYPILNDPISKIVLNAIIGFLDINHHPEDGDRVQSPKCFLNNKQDDG